MIYLDNSATTRPYDGVIRTMNEVMENHFGNPSSVHKMGVSAQKYIADARQIVAKSIKASPSEIFFTSGGTEGDNLAIFGAAYKLKRRGRRVITSAGEHPAVLNSFAELKKEGFDLVVVPFLKGGALDMDFLRENITPDTVLVSVMLVNNELGHIYPIADIKKAIRAAGSPALLHTDAVQGYLKVPFGVSSLGADLITLSAHKIHGPKGCGALYVKGGANTIHARIFGGGQETDLRSGTENTPAIAGFGQAVKTAEADPEQRMAKLKSFKEYTISLLTQNGCGAVIHSPAENGAPHILNISMPGLKSEVVLNYLDAEDIYVSSGSACSSRKKTASHVLLAAGFTKQEADSSIRISFGDFNEKEDCERLAECLKKCREELFPV